MTTLAQALEASNRNHINRVRSTGADAYIDTVEAFFPSGRSSPVYRQRLGRLVECVDKQGRCWGQRLILNQPSREALRQLAQLLHQHPGSKLRRVDVALDMQATNSTWLRQMLVTHSMLRWRRQAEMQEIAETVYWERVHKARNLVLYSDKPNKITGELDCCHLELRFTRAKVVKRHGLDDIGKLLKLNPRQLFLKHVKWSEAATRYVNRIAEQEGKKAQHKLASANIQYPLLVRYYNNIPRRTRYVLTLLGYDRVQNLKQLKPRLVKKGGETDQLMKMIPTRLSWKDGRKGQREGREEGPTGRKGGRVEGLARGSEMAD
jgi:hypothetical protein